MISAAHSNTIRAVQVGGLVVLALAVGCENSITPPPPPPAVAAVMVAPGALSLDVGGQRALAATLRAANGEVLIGRTVLWTSSNEEVATVSAAGQVTAVAAGSATIRASSESRSGSATVSVLAAVVPVASVEIESPAELTLGIGVAAQLEAVAKAADGTALPDREITWATGQPLVASVSSSELVTAHTAGRTMLSASSEGRTASIEVVVPESYAFDLMFDSRTGFIPGLGSEPEIFRFTMGQEDLAVRVLEHPRVSEAAPSPDGTRLAFTCVRVHGPAICVWDLNGGGLSVLTTGPTHADQPAWSPDGTKIAFRRWPQGATPGQFNPTRIWVMNADGSGQTNLTGNSAPGSWQESPTWSPRQPDGSVRIAYSHQSKSGEYVVGQIYSVLADGTDLRAVTAGGPYLETEPAWAPDGGTIVFVRTGGTAHGDLWSVNSGGGGERQLIGVDPADDQRSPAWSPDGRYIAFTSKHEPTADNRWSYQIYTVRGDGTELTRRTHSGIDKENPAWIRR
jgi:dipeptidyl aminopeptidase/acylaminoacyl peptidase